MDRTSKRLVLLAVICALAVGFGVFRFMSNLEALALAEYTEEVVVATKDIGARVVVTSDMVRVERVPVGASHAQAAAQVGQIVGQLTTQPIVSGEQVLTTRLFSSAQQSGMSYQLAGGFRAISIGINQKISVAYQVRPGDFVDVIVSYEQATVARESTSAIMLQGILVLAVGSEMKAGAAAPVTAETITLAVKPDQAERLVWAEDYGKIRLVLRPVSDSQNVYTPGATAHSVAER